MPLVLQELINGSHKEYIHWCVIHSAREPTHFYSNDSMISVYRILDVTNSMREQIQLPDNDSTTWVNEFLMQPSFLVNILQPYILHPLVLPSLGEHPASLGPTSLGEHPASSSTYNLLSWSLSLKRKLS
ncbi:hypothetical protein CEXT_207911 [Caerostris extrusa]|uniref:Uncharacterized protein n=1 Tax=Caerostris extrusa TaxID=172846 RepID=A0AAV4TKG7_CAEEX|nr:hypothetical protein CEXT_207911 [Caerostris extrusa]